jgi:hypothetical protein
MDIELVVMTNADKHVIFLTCYGKKDTDFLAPVSDTAPNIRTYFDSVFPKEN